MKIHLFDNTPPDAIVEKHGILGKDHCYTITVDYEYQIEMWIDEISAGYPEVIRATCPDLGRTWIRDGNILKETNQ